jgi:hypothetical protein
VTPENEKNITITVTGDVDTIEADVCANVTITGSAKNVRTGQGDIDIRGDVQGDVKTGQGNIAIGGTVTGSVKTGQGNIKVNGSVHGGARTSQGNVT